ncbi:MAG: UDP-N-acetylmuramoyl-L-alanyl-D-glutamate--2,6-diaminopimelate ligase [Rickettsiales bacterium]|nr:UDP-N-acetylmuramoyl-L-alanyl-D-glutamate--2,6-diaminopimelate ligase [Rickettsiales bacterium]
MKFSQFTYQLDDVQILFKRDFDISSLISDSRKTTENSIFFALKGQNFNGEDFIHSAIEKGSKAIITYENFAIDPKYKDISFIKTKDVNELLNRAVQVFYRYKIPEKIYGVTGTNGKTSVANFTANILAKLGVKSASIGTLGTLIDGDFEKIFSDSGMTTPDILTLFENLKELKNQNINEIVMEASSHGLFLERLGFIKFLTAGFTNFSQDHLDFHKTMEEYFAAKMLIFTKHLSQNGVAIVNSDIEEFEKIKNICEKNNKKLFSFGKKSSDLKIKNIALNESGIELELQNKEISKTIKTNLIGRFQGYNLACTIAMLINNNYDFSEICEASQNIKSVKGRMELIPLLNGKAKAVIDYAHTPDALEKAIISCREQTSGKLITLFGCGGDRDKTKRPLMGEISSKLSDITIVTDDNPRTENASIIRKEIISTCPNAIEIENREIAIKKGLEMLKPSDCLLIAGKGHENYQIIGKEKFHFSDFEIVKKFLP